LLKSLQYNLHVNQKTREGSGHKDRNAQFEYINARTEMFQPILFIGGGGKRRRTEARAML
jgi:hypothetical protein